MRARRLRWAAVGIGVVAAGALFYAFSRGENNGIVVVQNSVAAIDAATNRVVADIPVGSAPTSIVLGDDALWVLNTGEQTISQIDIESRQRTRTLSAGTVASDIAFSLDTLWVANAERDVLLALNTQTGNVEKELKLGIPHLRRGYVPARVALAAGARRVWATGGDLTTVVIDARSRRVTRRIAGISGMGADASPAGPELSVGVNGVWATDGRNQVVRLDVTPRQIAKLGGFDRDQGVADLAVGGQAVWAVGKDAVWRIDPVFATPEGTTAVGAGPTGIVIGANSVWTANAFDGTVSRMNLDTGRITTITLGGSPSGIAFADGQAWVTVS
jgi:YVTN family beta-propeller protein